MSNFVNKMTAKVKKKVGRAVDRFRFPPRESRGPSPAPPQQSEETVFIPPDPGSSALVPMTSPMAQSFIAIDISPPAVASPTADNASSPSPEPIFPVIPVNVEPPSPPTALSTTGSAVKELLVAAHDGSNLFLPLKTALAAVVSLSNLLERNFEVDAEFTKLESRLVVFKGIANAHEDEPSRVDPSLQARLKSITRAVQQLWEAIEKWEERGRVAQSSVDVGSDPSQATPNSSELLSLLKRINSQLEVFELDGSIAVDDQLTIARQRLTQPQPPVDIQSQSVTIANDTGNTTYNFGRDVVNNSYVSNTVNNTVFLQKQEAVMKTINLALGDNFVSEAAGDEQPSYAGCMVGTRVGVLLKFITWVKNDPLAIFWLAGMAGTGKTSIAVSLCRMLREDPEVLLGGGYFCSRSTGSIARTDVRRILPTLAVLLAGQSQGFAEALALELEKDPRVGHKPVTEQIGPLLRRPLAALITSSRPIVFVIDALDECSNERELAELLRLLVDFKCDAKVEFILTSRPEIHIRGTPISNPTHSTTLQLHTISMEEVMSDIRLYFDGTLNDAAPGATWYTDHDIDRLVKLSGGLFIFASTVLKYILHRDEDEDRQDRLHKATSATITRTTATSSIDTIYELVLMEAVRPGTVDEDELERMKRIFACILTARMSLSVGGLAALINVTPGRLRGSLERLHSLVYIPADDEQPGLRTLHASLGDYLFERGPQHIRVPATLGHDILARGCLRRLAQEDLCFNISRSRSSFEPNPEGPPAWIPLPLIYACLHWAHHIDAASDRSQFDTEIGRVFCVKFLFWLEVLSVFGKVGIASGLLRIAGSAVKLSAVSQFLRDANAFVASSHAAISRSATHIYISALPFAAKDSLVYHEFAPLLIGVVSVATSGIDRHGGRLVATLSGHEDRVNSIACSPDGRLLVSGSIDGTVRIWDTRTGEEAIAPLRGNDGKALSVAFSPDGKRVASGGEDEVVHVWSIETGREALPPLRGHSNWIHSVAYSRDGKLIASGSEDHTVRLWSAETGREISVIYSHTDKVNAIAFSPDDRLLASGSKDKTVRLWNLQNSQTAGDPLTSLDDAVRNVAFSPDGRWLAAGTLNTNEIRIWDLETLQPTPVVIRKHIASSLLVYSPDGSMILSSGRSSILFWDPQTGQELVGSSLTGNSDWVKSVAFSPDGLFLASGSADRTVKIWDSVGGLDSVVQTLQGHSGPVNSVVVSHDSTFIVSGSSDESVRVWDASTGVAKLQPLIGHTGMVSRVAISSDGRLIASASADITVRFWDTQTGEPTGETLQGHEGEVRAVDFSSDSQWLASGADDKTVRVWDVTTREVTSFSPLACVRGVRVVKFSPDGLLLAAGDVGGYIHIWRSGTDQRARKPLRASLNSVWTVAFSPDSRKIVSGAGDDVIRVWDIEDGHQVHALRGHSSTVHSVAYSPDSRYLVSGSQDKTLRFWDANTGAAIVTLFGHSSRLQSVTFTPNGESVISGGGDATIHSWDVEAALLLSGQAELDPLARLGAATLEANGWLVGSSGELLLWLPTEYRGHIQLPPCSMIIASHRVELKFDDGVHWGNEWTACWRSDIHPTVRASS